MTEQERHERTLAKHRRYNTSEKGRARSLRFDATFAGKLLKQLRDAKPEARLRRRLNSQQRQNGY